MLRSLLHKTYLLGVRIANIGVYEHLSFQEKKKTQVMNLSVAAGSTPKLVFGLSNLIAGKYILGSINFLLLFGGIAILIIHSYRKFVLARLIMIFSASLLFAISVVLYRNGAEYYLLANLIIITIFFNEKRYVIGIAILNCILFVGLKIFLNTSSFVYDSVPFSRVIFNVSWAFVMMVLALWFFKWEQIAYLAQIEQKNNELEKINKTKEKLFSIIAHDLRSPIGQLKNSLDLVNRDYISPEQFQEISTRLGSQVDQLHNTLDNLLRWSLSQLQGISAKPERTQLDPVLQSGLRLFVQKMEQKDIALVTEGTQQTVFVDPDHLLLVLRNLVSNAIKYSHPHSTISIHCHSNGSKEVTIAIRDTGIGMPESMSRAIFDTDNIVSNPGTANEKGTGLGLKLCKEFVEKNKGRMHVESRENAGTTFYVHLPQAV
jgi:two-component system sensor histidine kinase/response regulator